MTFWNFFFLILIYVPLIMLWVFALVDLAQRKDLSGLARGLWAVAIVLLPLFGMLVYFIAKPDIGAESPGTVAQPHEVAATEPAHDKLDEIERMAELRDSGALTDEEFATMKAKILG